MPCPRTHVISPGLLPKILDRLKRHPQWSGFIEDAPVGDDPKEPSEAGIA